MTTPARAESLCGVEWSTDFDDTYYRVSACCDQPEGHGGERHAGPVTVWSGEFRDQEIGVRLEWPT